MNDTTDLERGWQRLGLLIRAALSILAGLALLALACVFVFGVGGGLMLFFVGFGLGGACTVAAVYATVHELVPALARDDSDWAFEAGWAAMMAAGALACWTVAILTAVGVFDS